MVGMLIIWGPYGARGRPVKMKINTQHKSASLKAHERVPKLSLLLSQKQATSCPGESHESVVRDR